MSDDMTDRYVKTLPVPEAGRKYFGLGRNASYAAAKRGDPDNTDRATPSGAGRCPRTKA